VISTTMTSILISRTALLGLGFGTVLTAFDTGAADKWFKGNLHTHTLWSDGDDYPEMVVNWYRQHDYDFLSITDHDRMLEGERWISTTNNKGGEVALKKYLAHQGANWVERRITNGVSQVRLKTLEEFRGQFEKPREFLLIPGEEISAAFKAPGQSGAAPIHLNGINLREVIKPKTGSSVADVMQKNIDAVLEQRKRTGQPMFPHINHPNFQWAVRAEDMVALVGEKFFEVFNGHSGVRNYGDGTHASMERLWDIILTRRAVELGLEPMWGTATDDSHAYHVFAVGKTNPGRGWVMVRARELTPAAIIDALEAGDFYASSGVRLSDLKITPKEMRIEIEPEKDVTFTTQFIGTRKGIDLKSEPVVDANGKELPVTRQYSRDIGVVLAEVKGNLAVYPFKGDEIYVRAKVVSSKLKENPYAEGDHETAWIQPHVTGVK
jgi:hypothetical protein